MRALAHERLDPAKPLLRNGFLTETKDLGRPKPLRATVATVRTPAERARVMGPSRHCRTAARSHAPPPPPRSVAPSVPTPLPQCRAPAQTAPPPPPHRSACGFARDRPPAFPPPA